MPITLIIEEFLNDRLPSQEKGLILRVHAERILDTFLITLRHKAAKSISPRGNQLLVWSIPLIFVRLLPEVHDAHFSLNFIPLSPILIIRVRHLGRGERGMDWKKLLGSITTSVDEELRRRNTYLAMENRMLRQQIPGRVQLTAGDRRTLAELGQKLGRKALAEVATVAQPVTILA
jgi:hypothetical protein